MNIQYTPTTCPYCGCGCGFNLVSVDGKLKGVEPWKRNPVNEGKLCPKGNFSYEFVHREDRLTTPLIKKGGEFVEATWDEALDLVASKLGEIKDTNPEALAFLSSARCTNEENYLMQKLVRAVIGTHNIDHCARLCHGPTVAGLAQTFGSGAMTNSLESVAHADCIFIIGSNTLEQHPLMWRRVLQAKAKGAKLIVADPRFTPSAKKADLYLPFKSGTDVALMNAMMNVIISEGLEDKEFIENRTKNFEELKAVVMKYPPEKVADITEASADLIKEAARMYAKADNAAIIYSMGITQHTTGTDNVMSTSNLAMITGNLGRPGTGVNPLRGQNNVQGACDMGALPVVYPGYQKVIEGEMAEKMMTAWGCGDLTCRPGLTVIEMMNAADAGDIKGMYIMGENPMVSDPDIKHVKEGLESLDFLVVQDIFLTETAELADVVLPATSWAEKDGTFTSTERRVQYIRKAVDAPGEARSDWSIICDIAKKMGSDLFNYDSPQDIFEEVRTVTPQYAGMNKERLEKPEALHWPCPDEEHPGTPILWGEKCATPDGLGVLMPIEFIPPAELTDEEYPFTLTTGRMLFHWHTGSMTRRSKTLDREVPTGFVEINTEDAAELGIKNKELVRVKTRRGEIEIGAKVTPDIMKGIIFIPFHFVECAANTLTQSFALDPAAKMPEFKVSAASIEKME
ncbi:formate dehydrogenase subunit alpha [Methanobacterium sp.]|uniref:formate dehydrogenase subunit alpha n=1 Tax=Methanobacterium sp. TaxID=2164 RepID=UPI002ABA7DBE|nr:formate dehydrogenase subunit alpha [Methanobacterium sp.]MDY9924223.1 formate dehydrogenase subunit alpha [Methanobacterium sp.]